MQICHLALSEPDGTPTMYVQTDSNGRQTVASRVKTIVTSSSQVRIVKIGGTSLIESTRENRTFPTSSLEPGVNGIATFYPKDENFSAEFPSKVDMENS
jgi:hypothetical protein